MRERKKTIMKLLGNEGKVFTEFGGTLWVNLQIYFDQE
jgi:hypothetical protein